MKKAGDHVTFYKIAGVGHGDPGFNLVMMRVAVLAFSDKYLKPYSGVNP